MAKIVVAWKDDYGSIYETLEECKKAEHEDRIRKDLSCLLLANSDISETYHGSIISFIVDNIGDIKEILM